MPVADDAGSVAAQLGRPVRGRWVVVSRCGLGLPTAIRVEPLLDDGTPFPTLYWLTCPLARRRIGRLEAGGGVAQFARRADEDDEFGARLERAHDDYRRERDALVADPAPPHLPRGGVGGSAGGRAVKCLHAHYAHTLGGAANPVGEAVRVDVEPLDCTEPCVVGGQINRAWREPRTGGD